MSFILRKKSTFRRWALNCVLPIGIVSFIIWGYYFGSPFLHGIIGLSFDGFKYSTQREVGPIESFQHLLLLGTAVLLYRRSRLEPQLRPLLLVAALFVCWILLEELDYGYHYVLFFTGEELWQRFNVHNFVPGALNFFTQLSLLFFWLMSGAAIFGWLYPRAGATSRLRSLVPDLSFALVGPAYYFTFVFTLDLARRPRTVLGAESAVTGLLHTSPPEFSELLAYLFVFFYVRQCGIEES